MSGLISCMWLVQAVCAGSTGAMYIATCLKFASMRPSGIVHSKDSFPILSINRHLLRHIEHKLTS